MPTLIPVRPPPPIHDDSGPRDVIVIGASAGGFHPMRSLLRSLPWDLPAAVLVVLHVPEIQEDRLLPELLAFQGALAETPIGRRGEDLAAGCFYVASPGLHLVIRLGRIWNSGRAKVGFHRPSIDLLFRSAAVAYGPRVIGVVLSGTGSDGSSGLKEIKRRGGSTLVQEPAEAVFAQMPNSAIAAATPDYQGPVARIGELLRLLARA